MKAVISRTRWWLLVVWLGGGMAELLPFVGVGFLVTRVPFPVPVAHAGAVLNEGWVNGNHSGSLGNSSIRPFPSTSGVCVVAKMMGVSIEHSVIGVFGGAGGDSPCFARFLARSLDDGPIRTLASCTKGQPSRQPHQCLLPSIRLPTPDKRV